jgi:dipeptidyl aminopeptidase/acylaminoacyl peptidase
MRYILLLLILLNAATTLQGQQSELSVQKIMQDPKSWVGTSPTDPFWSEDGQTLYFKWNPEAQPGDSLYKVTLRNTKPVKVSLKEELDLPSSYGDYNVDKSQKIFSRNGDVFIYNIKGKTTKQLTNTIESESSPAFTSDGTHITFEKDNNLYLLNLKDGAIKQLTNFTSTKAKNDDKLSEQDKWLAKDNLELIQILKESKDNEDKQKAYRKFTEVKRPKIFNLNGYSVNNITLSPQEDYITFTLWKRADEKNTVVPNYIDASGYTEDLRARSKVGGDISDMKVGIYNLQNDSIYMVVTDDLPGLKDPQDYIKDYEASADEPTKREVISTQPVWSADGEYLAINIRSKDNKDRWIAAVNPEDGSLKVLDRQRDEAWIAGPGIGWTFGGGVLDFMPDNKSIYFQSEESGYSHLYTVGIDGKNKKALTKGEFEIYDPKISSDKSNWHFEANIDHPGIRNVYSMPLKGGKITPLTKQIGKSEAIFSPDESKLAILFSTSNQPTELFMMDNPTEVKKPKKEQITESTTEDFKAYEWRKPEVITFEARDKAEVYARLYKPDAAKSNGAAVVFVHGAGYLQNAHYWWSSYFREYMFHNLLVDLGYTVLDIDYRGSAGYGRDWRTGIYRHMGGKDLTDQVDGVKYLVESHGVNANKIGIYGGSYGGFITLMGMFTTPDVFAAGAALRSVTDWAHYNHGYTSNILNIPIEDSIAYRKSSPIYYAEGLEGALLICHGMVDTNVHFQDVVRLAQRLIELGKQNWEMAVYPVENHGFVEPSSWTDEYRRILKLFEENLRE